MTEAEREKLIEKMAKAVVLAENASPLRVALAVAEPVIREQADKALREENARLREALRPFVPETHLIDPAIPDTRPIDVMVRAGELRAAAAAIQDGKTKHVP